MFGKVARNETFQENTSFIHCFCITSTVLLACCADVFFFNLANSEKKMSADLSDLLSSNMAVQLSFWSIIIYFPNPGK